MSIKLKKQKQSNLSANLMSLRRVGNSHVVTIPQTIVTKLKLSSGDRLEVRIGDHCRSCGGGDIVMFKE